MVKYGRGSWEDLCLTNAKCKTHVHEWFSQWIVNDLWALLLSLHKSKHCLHNAAQWLNFEWPCFWAVATKGSTGSYLFWRLATTNRSLEVKYRIMELNVEKIVLYSKRFAVVIQLVGNMDCMPLWCKCKDVQFLWTEAIWRVLFSPSWWWNLKVLWDWKMFCLVMLMLLAESPQTAMKQMTR